jgi:hypothetical protein
MLWSHLIFFLVHFYENTKFVPFGEHQSHLLEQIFTNLKYTCMNHVLGFLKFLGKFCVDLKMTEVTIGPERANQP